MNHLLPGPDSRSLSFQRICMVNTVNPFLIILSFFESMLKQLIITATFSSWTCSNYYSKKQTKTVLFTLQMGKPKNGFKHSTTKSQSIQSFCLRKDLWIIENATYCIAFHFLLLYTINILENFHNLERGN